MKEIKTKTIFFSDVKRFVKHLNYRIYIIQLFILSLLVLLICSEFILHKIETKQINSSNQAMLNRLDKLEKKVDFRYFNTTHSLEEIHDIRIDTLNGSLRH